MRETGERRSEGSALGNLGHAWKDMGDIRKAIEFYEQRLEVAQELSDRRGECIALSSLGLSEAESMMRRAIAIDEAQWGSSHPDLAGHLLNLSQLLHEAGEVDEAKAFVRRAVAIDEEFFGSEYPRIAISLATLAQQLREKEDMVNLNDCL